MKKIFLALTGCLVIVRVQASLVADDFNRADTVASSDMAVSIGSGWISGNGTNSTAGITNFAATPAYAGGGRFLMVNTNLNTLNDASSFTLSGTAQLNVATTSVSIACGVVFNWQDANNYYIFRYTGAGTVQMARVVNGTIVFPLNEADAFAPVRNRPYKLTVSSSDPYVFDFSILDTVTDTIVYSTNGVTDTQQKFKDGFGGFFTTTAVYTHFDDLSLEVADVTLSPQSGEVSFGSVLPLGTQRASTPDGDDASTADTDLNINPATAWKWYTQPDGMVTLNLSASSNLTGTGETAVLTVWNWWNKAVYQRTYTTPFTDSITFSIQGRGSYLVTFDRIRADETTYSRKPRNIAAFRDNNDKYNWWSLGEFMLGACAVPERQAQNTNIGTVAPAGLSYSNSALKEVAFAKRLGLGSIRVAYVSTPSSYMDYDGGWGIKQYYNAGIRPFVKVPQDLYADLLPQYQPYTNRSNAWTYPRENRGFFNQIISDTKTNALFYEILNESDSDDWFGGTAQECADIILDFFAARNAGGSSKPISCYGTSLRDDSFDQVVYSNVFAVTSGYQTFHFYGTVSNLALKYQRVKDNVESAGFNSSDYNYIITESGGCNWRLDQETIASQLLVKDILVAWAAGIKGFYIYMLRDTCGSRLNSGGTLADNAWGLLDHFFCPRAEGTAIAGLVEHYAGAAFNSVLYQDSNFHCYRFDRSGGDKYISLINTAQTLSPTLTITFNTSLSSLAFIDDMGNPSYIDPRTSQINLSGAVFTLRTNSDVTPSVTKINDTAYRINL